MLRRMPRRILLVDPDVEWLEAIRLVLSHVVDVDACVDFAAARVLLFETRPEFLVTNVRLGPYNGLHLVQLATVAGLDTRCIVYDERIDLWLAREAQAAGAFFEPRYRLQYALRSYFSGRLPRRDRRDPARLDRRGVFRGGRRATDLTVVRLDAGR